MAFGHARRLGSGLGIQSGELADMKGLGAAPNGQLVTGLCRGLVGTSAKTTAFLDENPPLPGGFLFRREMKACLGSDVKHLV